MAKFVSKKNCLLYRHKGTLYLMNGKGEILVSGDTATVRAFIENGFKSTKEISNLRLLSE